MVLMSLGFKMLELINNLILDNHIVLVIAFITASIIVIVGGILSSIIK